MQKKSGVPKYPPVAFIRITDRLRHFCLHLYRRMTHPNVAVFEMIHHFWLAAAIGVVTELGIADHLKRGKKSIDELAKLTGTNTEALYRIMRMLASNDIFREDKDRYFKSTSLSEALQEDQVRYLVMSHLTKLHFQMFSELMYAVKTGKRSADIIINEPLYEYMGSDKVRSELFNKAMTDATLMQTGAVISVFNFAPFKMIIDIGGGEGLFLAEILNSFPGHKGIVFDLSQASQQCAKIFKEYEINDRAQFVSGSFFENIPGGGDLYLLKNILHNWDDDSCIAILKNLKASMPRQARLLVIETFIEPPNIPSFGKMSDILMMVSLSGKERTMAEFKSLFAEADLKIHKIHKTVSPFKIMEVVIA